MCVCVCLSVCTSIRTHKSGTTRPNFTRFSVYVLGALVLLQQLRNTLCISGFVVDVVFLYIGPDGGVMYHSSSASVMYDPSPLRMVLVASSPRYRQALRLDKSFIKGCQGRVCNAQSSF